MLPPFRLYGLIGCPHCDRAEQFMRERQLPTLMILSNDDPIIAAGIEAKTGEQRFPVLCCTITKEIITGFKEEEYVRLAHFYHNLAASGALASASAPSPSPSQQQSGPEATSQAPKILPRTN